MNQLSEQPHPGIYAGFGFKYVNLIVGTIAFVFLVWAQRVSSPDSAINEAYQECPMWAPGLIWMIGPTLGCLDWCIEWTVRRAMKGEPLFIRTGLRKRSWEHLSARVYAWFGFKYLSLAGGLILYICLAAAQKESSIGSPINQQLSSCPIEAWGILFLLGPIVGWVDWRISQRLGCRSRRRTG
jgi:hypothetical protein